jgi:hypothetical protein
MLDFAKRQGLDEEKAIDCVLNAARLGLLELRWNVLVRDVAECSMPVPR